MNMRSFIIALVIISVLFAGCYGQDPLGENLGSPHAFCWENGDALISNDRVGLSRQGVSFRNFSVNSETGVYYISTSNPFLLYVDNDSDYFVPLCNRPDCLHADQDFKDYNTCNAYYPSLFGITYVGGKLFVAYSSATERLIVDSVDPDGTNRKTVATLSSMLGAYDALAGVSMWNGILLFGVSSSDGNDQFYYYKLDASSSAPIPCLPMGLKGNDGVHYIGYSLDDGKTVIHEWNPDTNSMSILSQDLGYGYYGTESAIVMNGSRIVQHIYQDHSEYLLLDTNLSGECIVHVFPDCLCVNSISETGQQKLSFYNWAFESIGQVTLDFPIEVSMPFVICGETKESIFLTGSWHGLPQYRIDKGTLGTESVKIIPLDLPYLPVIDVEN